MENQMKIAIASDHAGFHLKESLSLFLQEKKICFIDYGTNSESTSVDYPDFAKKVCEEIRMQTIDRGILICGTGIGMSMAANRYPEVRAALCHDGLSARLARQHNNANILVLGSRLIGLEPAKEALINFLEAPFEGGRHRRRLEKFDRSLDN